MKLTTLLAILQQSEYELSWFETWYQEHQSEHLDIQPQQWTTKLQLINAICHMFFFLPILPRMRISVLLVKFPEEIVRGYYYFLAKRKLESYRKNGLIVIGIAGSYAKTSTKHIIFHTISPFISTLITPKSINTKLGIAHVILDDLQSHHKLFVVEFGEYNPGDLEKLYQFIQPDYGILTPIGHQHLDRLGGIAGIVTIMKKYVASLPSKKHALIAEENAEYFSQHSTFYGKTKKSQLRVDKTDITRAGTEFEVILDNHHALQKVFSPLFGEHQAVNTLPGLWIAHQLNISSEQVIKKVATLPYIYRRHEPTFAEHNVLILDNSYNTNPDSAKESFKLINQLAPTRRLLITLGFLELGDQTEKIHRQFGKELVKQMDYIGLIEAPWTQTIIESFIEHGGNKSHIFIGKDQDEAFAKIQQFVIPGSVILFEGGYQEVYV